MEKERVRRLVGFLGFAGYGFESEEAKIQKKEV